MLDPKKINTPKDANDPSDTAKPDAVGFGAFSEKYRARWVANHPDMQRRFPVEYEKSVLDAPASAVTADKPEAERSANSPTPEKE